METGVDTEELRIAAALLGAVAADVRRVSSGLSGSPDGVTSWTSGRGVIAARAFLDAVLWVGGDLAEAFDHLAGAGIAAAENYEGVERDVAGVLLPRVGGEAD